MIEDPRRDIDETVPRPKDRASARGELQTLVFTSELGHATAQKIWDRIVSPLYDARDYQEQWPHGNCRHCFIPHPKSRNGMIRTAQGRTWGHAMRCPKYVGPLEHQVVREDLSFLGTPRSECSCGARYWTYQDDDWTVRGVCPDILFIWRGPRPEPQEDVMSEPEQVKPNQQVQDEQGVASDSQVAVQAEQERLENLARNNQVGPDQTEDEDHEPSDEETADKDDAEHEQGKKGETYNR